MSGIDFKGMSQSQRANIKAMQKMQDQALATQAAVTILNTKFNSEIETSKAAKNASNKIQG